MNDIVPQSFFANKLEQRAPHYVELEKINFGKIKS